MTPWPDAKLEAKMLADTRSMGDGSIAWHLANDLACHVKALLSRVRELERDIAAVTGEMSIVREQTESAASRSQKWKDLALSAMDLDEPLPPGTLDEHFAELLRRREAKRKQKARMDAGDRRDWDECNRLEGIREEESQAAPES